jgi:hypothetical protein
MCGTSRGPETLNPYGARTRVEIINAARLISLSFAAFELSGAAKSTGMPPTPRQRCASRVHRLNRACQHDGKARANRLACDVPDAELLP